MARIAATLEAPRGFHLKATVLSHGWHECAPMSWSEGGRCFQLIDRLIDRVVRVSVVPCDGTTGNSRVAVLIDGSELAEGDEVVILDRLSDVLGLNRDLSEFYALCAKHVALKAVPRIGAGRLLRSASMTENILKFLCSTNVNWTQAVKMINRIAQLGPYHPHFRSLNAWPTPREILKAGKPYLIDVCRLGYRAESILQFCRDVLDGAFDPESLVALADSPDVSSDELVAQLRTIKGIGPASAHALLSMLGRYDQLSIDSATIAHAARVHFNGRKPSPREVERVYEPYGKWKNLVYWCESWLHWETAKEIARETEQPPERSARTRPRTEARAQASRS